MFVEVKPRIVFFLQTFCFMAFIATVEKIITYALGEHDPGSAQDWRTPNYFCSPGPGLPEKELSTLQLCLLLLLTQLLRQLCLSTRRFSTQPSATLRHRCTSPTWYTWYTIHPVYITCPDCKTLMLAAIGVPTHTCKIAFKCFFNDPKRLIFVVLPS